MDFFRDYLQKHKWILFLWVPFNFVIIFLPQWLDSIWSLAEKITGRQLAMSFPNIEWAYWITVPVGLIMFSVTIWAYKSRKPIKEKGYEIVPKLTLTETLTSMHRRLVELQKEKASRTKIRYRQWEKAMPTLADRMGTVKLEDWSKFMKDAKRRFKKATPKPKIRNKFDFLKWANYREKVRFASLSVALQIKDELCQSKDWTVEDGLKVSDWLDGFHWGVTELRDNDQQWNTLFGSISGYLQNDNLRYLIKDHIDFSRTYNNVCLAYCYSGRYPKSTFSLMLHEMLVGAPISPDKAEIALSEILSKIEKQLTPQPDTRNNNLSITIEDKYTRVHKCSVCGWGYKVFTMLMGNSIITCPKCGNVEINTHFY